MENCSNNNLIVNIRTMRKPRFKAGAELSANIKKVDVEVSEVFTDDAEVLELQLRFENQRSVGTCPSDI